MLSAQCYILIKVYSRNIKYFIVELVKYRAAIINKYVASIRSSASPFFKKYLIERIILVSFLFWVY